MNAGAAVARAPHATEKLLQSGHETLATERAARPLVPAQRLGLVLRQALREELAPVLEAVEQPADAAQPVVLAGEVSV